MLKWVFAFLLLLAAPGCAEAQFSYFLPPVPAAGGCAGTGFRICAHVIAGSSDGNAVTSVSIDTTGADLIVLATAEELAPFCTPTDNKSNTYTALTAQFAAGASLHTRLFYKQAPSVGSGHTFTCSGTSGFPSIGAVAFAGSIVSPFDQESGVAKNNGISSVNTGSVTPLSTNELIVTSILSASVTTYSIDSGFTISDQIGGSGTHLPLGMAYLVESAIVSQNPLWSFGTLSAGAVAAIATFK